MNNTFIDQNDNRNNPSIWVYLVSIIAFMVFLIAIGGCGTLETMRQANGLIQAAADAGQTHINNGEYKEAFTDFANIKRVALSIEKVQGKASLYLPYTQGMIDSICAKLEAEANFTQGISDFLTKILGGSLFGSLILMIFQFLKTVNLQAAFTSLSTIVENVNKNPACDKQFKEEAKRETEKNPKTFALLDKYRVKKRVL